MKKVTLTFDNGPTLGITEQVLAILAEERLLSTFFVIGDKLRTAAEIRVVQAAHAAGHWIGNHTMTHSVALGNRTDIGYALREIEGTQERIAAFAAPAKLFRPIGDGGHIGPHLLSSVAAKHLLDAGYSTILWNSVPGDWKDQDGWVERCLEDVAAQEWSVVVVHDIEAGCLPRLPELLRRLRENGAVLTQEFPESVILTHARRTLNLHPSLISDGVMPVIQA